MSETRLAEMTPVALREYRAILCARETIGSRRIISITTMAVTAETTAVTAGLLESLGLLRIIRFTGNQSTA